jgi:hypothetical protein
MEQTFVELTPAQQDTLAKLSCATGTPIPALLDKALELLQARYRFGREHDAAKTPPPEASAREPR